MKIRWYDRLLMFLSGLVIIALGVCVILIASGVIDLPQAIALDTWLGDGWQWLPIVIAVGILLVLWGLFMVIRPFRIGKRSRKYYTLQNEKDGKVRISVHAIDHLVHKCLSKYEAIESARVHIGGHEDAMEITLHMALQSEVRIPELLDTVRSDIKQSLMHSAGVTVESVQVYVDETRNSGRDEEKKLIPTVTTTQINEEPADDYINTASFYTTPVVVTGDRKPELEHPLIDEPTVQELKEEIHFGPDEPMPVKLSDDAFPFPEKEAGVPLEIYTPDVPIPEASKEEENDDA